MKFETKRKSGREEEDFTAKAQRARGRSTKYKARNPKRKKSLVNGQRSLGKIIKKRFLIGRDLCPKGQFEESS